MSSYLDSVIDELDQKLGKRQFYTIRQIASTEIFGSLLGVRKALQTKRLGYVQVSPRRCVIPRAALLNYLSRNSTEMSCEHDSETLRQQIAMKAIKTGNLT